MKKYTSLIVFFLMSISFVSADLFFFPYDENVFTAKKIFQPWYHEGVVFSPFIEIGLPKLELAGEVEEVDEVEEVEEVEPVVERVEVLINEKDFDPVEVKIEVGQEIIWKNNRARLTSLVMGVREISTMNSGVLRPDDEFTYSFSKKGEFTYVDGIVIGIVGKVVVK